MIEAPTHAPPTDQLADVVGAIREAVAGSRGWADAAAQVSAALGNHLPTAAILSHGQRAGSPERVSTHLLHVEPDGSFSLVALICHEHQATEIHDHVTWCVFGLLAGEPVEELFRLDPAKNVLIPAGRRACPARTVSGGTPPGDIHRLTNRGPAPAISLHVYGTDVSRLGSSVRRIYDRPVRST